MNVKPPARGFRSLAIGLIACVALMGCNQAGQLSIEQGRMRYNDVIEQTTRTQLLLNLIRVSRNQNPLFIDVTEVDASLAFSSSLSASETGIGIGNKSGPFRVGSLTYGTISPSVAYSESPTIRYIPLQGQALVQQLAAPISVDSIAQLFDSDVPLPTLLNFTVDRLTPGALDYAAALNMIGQLDALDAITLAAIAARGEDAPRGDGPGKGGVIVQTVAPAPPRHTALVMYIQPTSLGCDDTLRTARLWAGLLDIYATVRTPAENAAGETLKSVLASITGCEHGRLIARRTGAAITKQALDAAMGKVPFLELRTEPLRAASEPGRSGGVGNPAPFLRTRAAFAIFRSIEVSDYEPTELIEIVTPAAQAEIADMPWNDGQQFHMFTYGQYCTPGTEINGPKCNELRGLYQGVPRTDRDLGRSTVDSKICQHGAHIQGLARNNPADDVVAGKLRRWTAVCGNGPVAARSVDPSMNPLPLLTIGEDDTSGATELTDVRRDEEQLLRKQRRYILVVAAPSPPAKVFASVEVDGTWYYIAADDFISQRNFRLLSLISTIQAVAPAAPLTPTVSVGGH